MKATGIVRRIDDLGPGGHPKGNSPNYAYPGGRPVTEHIGTVGAVLLRHAAPGRPGRMGKRLMEKECRLFAFFFIKCVV